MRFFIDTANVEDIKKANDMGVICGVTTNPSLRVQNSGFSIVCEIFPYIFYRWMAHNRISC